MLVYVDVGVYLYWCLLMLICGSVHTCVTIIIRSLLLLSSLYSISGRQSKRPGGPPLYRERWGAGGGGVTESLFDRMSR